MNMRDGICFKRAREGLKCVENGELPLWFRRLRKRYNVGEDGGLMFGISQWIKDLAYCKLQPRP